MATVVQTAFGSGSTTATPSAAFTGNTTSGNAIVLFISWAAASGSVSSVTDSQGNTYTRQVAATAAQLRTIECWAAFGITGGTTPTVTATLSASQSSAIIECWEASGLTGVVDGSAPNSGTATTAPTTGSLTTTNANDLLIALIRGGTLSAGSGGSWIGTNPQYQVVTSTGTYQASWTQTSNVFLAQLVAFKGSSTVLVVSSSAATSIGQTSATLNGSITGLGPGGNATVVGFHYGTTTSYGSTVQQSGSFGVGAFNQAVSGLSPGTLYHFQAFATSPDGTVTSTDGTFVTNFTDNPSGEVLFNGTQLSGGTTSTGSSANMFDGSNITEWTTSANGSWVGIDFGVATPLTRVRISPRGGFPDGGIGCQIQVSNDPTFVTGVTTLTTINNRLTVPTLSNEFDVSASALRYARVLANGVAWNLSDVDFIGTYASGVAAACVQPTISPPGGNFDQPVRVRISSLTGSHVFYTTDGSTPDASKTPYTGPFVVGSNVQVKAIAYATGLTPSRVASYNFFCPSTLFSHQAVYDNNNNRVTTFEGCYFDNTARDGYWYHYLMDLETPTKVSDNKWQGYRVYRSADFRNWSYRSNIISPAAGLALGAQDYEFRLQMFFCSTTGNYVAWTGPDANLHGSPGMRSYTSSSPEGPFTLVNTFTGAAPCADGFTGGAGTTYGDLGGFTNNDGKAYIVYNFNNNASTAISQLDPATFTNTLGAGVNSASYAVLGEGFAICNKGGTYFLVHSQLTGGAFNLNQYRTASAPIGPYSAASNPFQAVAGMPNLPLEGVPPDNTIAYQSQTSQIVNIPGRGAFVWVGDDNAQNPVSLPFINSSQLHIPMVFPTSSTLTITWPAGAWFDSTAAGFWNLDSTFPTVSGAPAAPSGLTASYSGGVVALGWVNNEPKAYSLYLDRASDSGFTQNVVSEVLASGTASFSDTNVTGGASYFYRVRAVNTNGTTSSLSMFLSIGGSTILTLQSFLTSLPPDDTVIWQGIQWRPGLLASTLAQMNDSRLALRIAVSGTSTALLNADGSTNSTPLTLIKRWWGQIE